MEIKSPLSPRFKMLFKKSFFFIFVFITGAAIMMIEMVAFRLMTLYFGASLFVWANVIGLVMIALSVGYYFGGKLADLHPQRKILMFIVLSAGICVSFLPIFSQLTLPYFVRISPETSPFFGSLILSSFFFILLLFLVPVSLLGAVSPFVIRLQNREVETTGYTSGSIYAFSTVGSIFGTFFSSFLTIPFFGIKETILISAVCLILISLIGLTPELKKPFFLILLFPIFLNLIPFEKRQGLIYEKESFHGLIEVIEDKDLGYVLDINRSGRWSVYHPDKILTGMYFDYFTPIYFLLDEKENLDVLIIGHAGGVFSRQYSYFFGDKNLKIDGIELDPEVSKAAYKFFDLKSQKGLNVINEDGRIYLQNSEKQYDLILIDAYIGGLYIPFQLSTKEFFELTKSHLKESGILAIMVLAEDQKEKTFQCLSQTIKSVYPHTFYFPGGTKREYIVVGSKLPLEDKFPNLEKRTDIEELKKLSLEIAEEFQKIQETKRKCLLTDNRAPTEMLREIDKISRLRLY